MPVKQDDLNKIVPGTAGLAGIWGPVDFGESEQTILRALEMGLVDFNTSLAYADDCVSGKKTIM